MVTAEMANPGKHWNSLVMPAPGLAPPLRDHRLLNPRLRWAHRNSFTFLCLSLLVIFILQGWMLTATFLAQGSIVSLLLCGTMAIQAVRYSDTSLARLCSAGAVTVVGNWVWWAIVPLLPDSLEYSAHGAGLLVQTLVLAMLVGVMLYHLWHNDYTGRNALFCAISSYLLIGFLWSCAYSLISYFSPGAFADNVAGTSLRIEGREIHESFHRFFYFSMITITTVGYGDMTPVAPLARHLAWIEAAIGQFYFAFILARLVSTQFIQGAGRASHPSAARADDLAAGESDIFQTINPAPGYPLENDEALGKA